MLAHSGALWLLWLTPFPTVVVIAVSLGLIGHGAGTVRRFGWLTSRQSINQIVLLEKAVGILRPGNSETESCLVRGSFVSRNLVVLRLKQQDGPEKYSVVVAVDSCTQNEFRALKKFLRLHPASDTDSGILG